MRTIVKTALKLVVCLSVLSYPFASAQEGDRIIVFLWDGTQRNHFLEAYNNGELPVIEQLVASGGLLRTDLVINSDTCLAGDGDGYETETGPTNSAIITGYGFPEMANQNNNEPNPIPPNLTLFERFEAGVPGAVTGIATGKSFNFWPTVPLSNAQSIIDFWFQGRVSNSDVANQAITFLQTFGDSPFFVWVHFRNPDDGGHRQGENSALYHDLLIDADVQMGRVLDELHALGLDQDTTVLVTTDHGFTEGETDHEACISDTKDIWIASNRGHVIGNFEVPAYQTSIAPTVFDIAGLDKNVDPPFPSQSLFVPDTGEVDLIVDNLDPGFSVVGRWREVLDEPTSFDNSYRRARGGAAIDIATFTPNLPVAGDYEVFGWWPLCDICDANTPYTINHTGGSTVVTVDQTLGGPGGQWVSLGVFAFEAGTDGTVQVSDETQNSVAADAMRFVLITP